MAVLGQLGDAHRRVIAVCVRSGQKAEAFRHSLCGRVLEAGGRRAHDDEEEEEEDDWTKLKLSILIRQIKEFLASRE